MGKSVAILHELRNILSQHSDLTLIDPHGELCSTLFMETAGIGNLGFALDRTSPQAAGPRQSVAFEGAVLHLLPPNWAYDAHQRRVIAPAAGPLKVEEPAGK